MNLPSNQKEVTSTNNSVSDKTIDEMKLKAFEKPANIFAKVAVANYLERKRVMVIYTPFLIDNNMIALMMMKLSVFIIILFIP